MNIRNSVESIVGGFVSVDTHSRLMKQAVLKPQVRRKGGFLDFLRACSSLENAGFNVNVEETCLGYRAIVGL
jgi:hypothetical protein